MMNDDIDDLIAQLQDFEIPYREGAWENLRQRRSRSLRLIFFQPLLKYVAVWFLMLAIPLTLQKNFRPSDIAGSVVTINHEAPELRMHGSTVAVSKKVVHGSTLKTDTTQDEQVNMRSISGIPSSVIEMSVPEPADARIAVVRLPLSGLRSAKDGFLEFLEKEQSKSGGQTAPAVVKRKLDYAFSIGVSTDSRTVERLNIEAGISYPLNKRLLVYSGISLGSFGTEQQLTDLATFEKSTKLVRADLNGITIPVEVEYRPNEHIFFKGGMSASLITKHHGTLSYNEKISSFQSFSDAEGNIQIKEVVIDKPVSEEITDANFTPSRPVLFYNLSAGYRIPLFTSARIAMEPYLRVPVTSYGEYKLNLFQGGLKFRLDF